MLFNYWPRFRWWSLAFSSGWIRISKSIPIHWLVMRVYGKRYISKLRMPVQRGASCNSKKLLCDRLGYIPLWGSMGLSMDSGAGCKEKNGCKLTWKSNCGLLIVFMRYMFIFLESVASSMWFLIPLFSLIFSWPSRIHSNEDRAGANFIGSGRLWAHW